MTSVLILAVGLCFLAYRPLTERNERFLRHARRLYATNSILFPARLLPAISPFLGISMVIAAIAAALPRPLIGWALIPALLMISIPTIMTYRIPDQWLPSWLRSDIVEGRLTVARPDVMDWVLLALVGPVLLLGPVALLFWLVT